MKKTRHAESLQYALDILLGDVYRPYIKAIYLYGSCARCEQTESSDVDLFLFLDKSIPHKKRITIRCDVIPDNYLLPEVDIHYSFSDRFSIDKTFQSELERDGRLLWERK